MVGFCLCTPTFQEAVVCEFCGGGSKHTSPTILPDEIVAALVAPAIWASFTRARADAADLRSRRLAESTGKAATSTITLSSAAAAAAAAAAAPAPARDTSAASSSGTLSVIQTEVDTRIAKHRAHIAEFLLTARCQNPDITEDLPAGCNAMIVDWQGCFAVTCARCFQFFWSVCL